MAKEDDVDEYWLLGKLFTGKRRVELEKDKADMPCKEDFNTELQLKLWITYRKKFFPLSPSTLTSDAGWGCMHRTTQMMLAESLWRVEIAGLNGRPMPERSTLMKTVLRHFIDIPGCAFSIHKICIFGTKMGRNIGEWFAPSDAAYVLNRLTSYKASKFFPFAINVLNQTIDVARIDQQIEDEFRARFKDGAELLDPSSSASAAAAGASSSAAASSSSPSSTTSTTFSVAFSATHLSFLSLCSVEDHFMPILLLFPIRLGQKHVDQGYIPALKRLFQYPLCVGIVGGEPRRSLWFVGYHQDNLYYLDPHTTQESRTSLISGAAISATAVDNPSSTTLLDVNKVDLSTYQQKKKRKIKISNIDPSMMVCFLILSRKELHEFYDWVEAFDPMTALFAIVPPRKK